MRERKKEREKERKKERKRNREREMTIGGTPLICNQKSGIVQGELRRAQDIKRTNGIETQEQEQPVHICRGIMLHY